MENEIYTFKTDVSNIVDKAKMKVWLARKYGKRVEHIFKVGEEQFTSPEVIVENSDYVLLGQNIKEKKEELISLFKQYFLD
ncbi:hypothetical protein Halha_2624 [Halobacteroides halobius DSM 5150]|uniref:Uncharacterized protein n=1 Tax=Halobacteroides halobius (strain ATCC 35273 / DSM 5150 / MD-1) TaxID=748449 RepID=L0KBV6_HALHC|nr:hypothetical protein [Halobacteroides halobius]AGB42496.1 hypothetical protein Halha_2624 [Halobacteroides halobius DSM 5150]